jgi:hypothetical protein
LSKCIIREATGAFTPVEISPVVPPVPDRRCLESPYHRLS